MEAKDLAVLIANAIIEKKGSNLKVLRIEEITTLADYFILANGNSRTQTQAIAENIEKRSEEAGIRVARREGYAEGRWILLDYSSVIVHIFQEEERSLYNLERLWGDAPQVPFAE